MRARLGALGLQLQADAVAAAVGQAVLAEHPLQHLHVGGDVQGAVLEQFVQLFFEALHHLVHHVLDAFLGGGDVLALDALVLQLGVCVEDFQGGGQVVVQKAAQLGLLAGLLFK